MMIAESIDIRHDHALENPHTGGNIRHCRPRLIHLSNHIQQGIHFTAELQTVSGKRHHSFIRHPLFIAVIGNIIIRRIRFPCMKFHGAIPAGIFIFQQIGIRQYEAEGENIFHRLITETTWAYFYEVNNYIAYYAEYVKTIIINAEGTGTQELILPYTPRAERLPDYIAIYEAIKAREEGTGGDDIGGGDTPIPPEDFTVADDDRNDFGPISGSN